MGRHVENMNRHVRCLSIPRKAWCEPMYDGFCYSFACENGMKGILVTGGVAGVHEFLPVLPCSKE